MPFEFNLKKIGQGIASVGIPFVFKGTINQFLEDNAVTIPIMVKWVTTNASLITLFSQYGKGSDFNDVLRRAGNICPDTDWLTTEYLIDACREEHPALASLFLGWDDAYRWLEKQVVDLHKAFAQANGLEETTAPETPQPAAAPIPKPVRSNVGLTESGNALTPVFLPKTEPENPKTE